jgi:hypothetical protein
MSVHGCWEGKKEEMRREEGREGGGREGGRGRAGRRGKERPVPLSWTVLCISLPWALVIAVWVGFVILLEESILQKLLKTSGILGREQ